MRSVVVALALALVSATASAVNPPQFALEWGAFGTATGQFQTPCGITVDGLGSIYVVDKDNHRIQKFDPNGGFVTTWGVQGTAPGEFTYPVGITYHAAEIYVVDHSNHRIQVFNTSGAFQRLWGISGLNPGDLRYPIDVAVDESGSVYVSDQEAGQSDPTDDRVEKFTSNGTFIAGWSVPNGAFGIHAGNGRVVVGGNLISVFDLNGNPIQTVGSVGSGPGQFQFAAHIARDGAGNFYVGDVGNNRIQMFDAGFQFLATWGSFGSAPGRFSLPDFVAVDVAGDVFVSDGGNHRIQKFSFPPVAVTPMPWSEVKRLFR